VYRSGRRNVHELPDCTRNPAPDRHAGSIADLPEFLGPPLAFRLGLVAVALEHQVGDAPDIDFRDHSAKFMKSELGPLMTLGNATAALYADPPPGVARVCGK